MNFDINKILEKYFGENDPIILACSTGPDSMYLLYKILETKYAKNLIACYFNHKTRPETDLEEAYLEKLGKEKGFKVESASCDFEQIQQLYPSKSFEELAREKRYQFFNAVINIYQGKYVLTAHHLDDRIETFFFNLARGSKLTGLINMTEESGGIIRPLLNITKEEIYDFLHTNNIKYYTDSTNENTDITRNFLRHEIVPKLETINTNYKKNLQNIMSYFADIKDFLKTQVEDFLYEQGVAIFNSEKYKINTLEIYGYFYISAFIKLPMLLQKEIIKHIFYISNNNSTIGLSEGNINEVIKFINSKNNKTVKNIKNMKLAKENEIIIFM